MFLMTADEIRRAHAGGMVTAELAELVFNLPWQVLASPEIRAVAIATDASDEALLAEWDQVMAAVVDHLDAGGLWGDRDAVIEQLHERQREHNARLAA